MSFPTVNQLEGLVPADPKLYADVHSRYTDRRFTAAVAAMQGMLAISYKPEVLAKRSVGFADALLAELSKAREND